ncbi:hypothetical protein [Phenylobacterium sp.]|uniref:DUF7662 domain-containing protein n=1 Tax=Phenylobacterium sp. TaxID=1871053 RepID=UPI00272FDD1F|nr:hypothetical protein [Phenylobacterium sp.]MDP2215491.1 hypothetical protein [Phenylobacterium sp.]
MSKYDPLASYLMRQPGDRVPLTFSEIEKVLGRPLPASKRYPAWWSNSPTNNPMTRVWLEAGFVTEQVDIPAQRLTFRRAKRVERPAGSGGLDRYPGYGAMRGTIRFATDLDLTAPADPEWGADG